MEGLEILKNAIVGGINNILSFFSTLLSYLNPMSENFILRGLIDLIIVIKEAILNILDYLNPFSDNFFLKLAFIPQSEEFLTKKQEFFDKLNQHFLFINGIKEFMAQIVHLSTGSTTPPEFKITMSSKYGGGTYSIVDFSMFAEYRIYIINVQRAIMWFFFIKSMFKSLPHASRLEGGWK